MQIRKNSWHYKVWAWSHLAASDCKHQDGETSLCRYFWRVVLALFWLPITALYLFAGKMIWISMNYLSLFAIPESNYYWHPLVLDSCCDMDSYGKLTFFFSTGGNIVWASLILISIKVIEIIRVNGAHWLILTSCYWLSMAIAVIAGLATVIMMPMIARRAYKKREKKTDDEPSLIAAYLKAAKDNVCPVINFTD
ncbi:MAG: hypothetical protein KGI60_00590 [Patescibacteria group bacterium]|nr:hypothetical protein [Patescibacteria group bacterium]